MENDCLPPQKEAAVPRHAPSTSHCLERTLSPPLSVLGDQCPGVAKASALGFHETHKPTAPFVKSTSPTTLQASSLECVNPF